MRSCGKYISHDVCIVLHINLSIIILVDLINDIINSPHKLATQSSTPLLGRLTTAPLLAEAVSLIVLPPLLLTKVGAGPQLPSAQSSSASAAAAAAGVGVAAAAPVVMLRR
jgi:hypothetical protein